MSGGLRPPIQKFSFQNPLSCNRKRHRMLCSNSTGGLYPGGFVWPGQWGYVPVGVMSANRVMDGESGDDVKEVTRTIEKQGFHVSTVFYCLYRHVHSKNNTRCENNNIAHTETDLGSKLATLTY